MASKAAADLSNEEVMRLAEERGMKVSASSAASDNMPIRKPLAPEEETRIKEIFDRYDADGSGTISLGELSKLFADLGATMSDEEVAKAMQELDKSKENSCNFEEFCMFWTSKPGLGGYSSMSLQFMKAKLKMMSGLSGMKASKAGMNLQRVRSGPPLADGEISVKFSGDFSPSLIGCEPKMEIKASLLKTEQGGADPEMIDLRIVLGATSVDAAKSACDSIQALMKVIEDLPFPVDVSQSEHTVVVEVSMPSAAADPQMIEMGGNLVAVANSAKASFAWSKDFDDVTKAPAGPLNCLLGACKIDGEVVLSSGAILSMANPEGEPPQEDMMWQAMKSAVGMMAGSEITVSLGYFEGQVKPMLSLFKNMFLRAVPMRGAEQDPMTAFISKFPDISLQQARDIMLKGMDDGPPPPAEGVEMLKCLQSLPEFVTGIESMTVSGLPGFDVNLSFQNFNPFPILAYMVEPLTSLAKMVPKRLLEVGMAKKLSPQEEAKLTDAFKKFDKDGSGQIDLGELKAMVEDLGGSMSDDEAAQAMKQLDKNNEGTCNFEEFKIFWSSKSGLGGYSSMALKFLKMKMQMEGLVGMGKSMFTRTRKPVNEADDTSVKVCATVTPEMRPYSGHRMSLALSVKASDGGDAFSPPKTMVRLVANSEEAAKEAAEACTVMMNKVQQLGMLPVLPTITVDADKVVFCLEPPADMVEMMQMQLQDPGMQQQRQMAVELGKACQTCEVVLGSAVNWDDFVASPDTQIPEAFQGAQYDINFSMSPQGKQAFLANMMDMGTPTTVAKALIRAFAGADIKVSAGFHNQAIMGLFPLLGAFMPSPDITPEALLTTAGQRDALKKMTEGMMLPMLAEMPPDALPIAPSEVFDLVASILERMKGIESVTMAAAMAPNPGEKFTRMETKITAIEFNIFNLAKFLLSPSIKALQLGAAPTKENNAEGGNGGNGIEL